MHLCPQVSPVSVKSLVFCLPLVPVVPVGSLVSVVPLKCLDLVSVRVSGASDVSGVRIHKG